MPSAVIEAVLIFLIGITLVSLALPFALNSIQQTSDIFEVDKVRTEFEICSDKLLDAARTGVGNSCLFSINKGLITVGSNDWIRYTIQSPYDICDKSDFVNINPEKYIWQGCNVTNSLRTFQLGWFSSSIRFEVQGFGGKTLEFSRKDATENYVTLLIKVS